MLNNVDLDVPSIVELWCAGEYLSGKRVDFNYNYNENVNICSLLIFKL